MRTEERIVSSIKELDAITDLYKIKKIFLCCGKSFENTKTFEYIKKFNPIIWDTVRPNPRYEDMQHAVKLFNDNKCDFIIGAGGGSPMDSAKMIKLMATNPGKNHISEKMDDNDIPFMCIPTTSGTGSEATRYSIFYCNNNIKYSVAHDGFLPQYVLLDASFLKTVPMYQRKFTCLDAFCHAAESLWSVNATDKSIEYAQKSLRLFAENQKDYIKNTDNGNHGMMMASYYAGKAINISSTTAAHALCYNLTVNCGTAHGHSVSVNMAKLWQAACNADDCDINLDGGRQELEHRICLIENAIKADKNQGLDYFKSLLKSYDLESPVISDEQAQKFAAAVNIAKLGNHPIKMTRNDVKSIYITKLEY